MIDMPVSELGYVGLGVGAAAAGIRARELAPTPSYQVCRYCAYNQICPSTATRE